MFHQREFECILEELAWLRRRLSRAESATLTLVTHPRHNHKGEHMPLTVHVNDKPGLAVFQEFDGPTGTGNKVPPTGAVTFASSNPAVATVDATSGALAYLSAGTTSISGADSSNGLTASDTLTVVAAPAVSATLTLVPGAQPPVQ
jgi:hypothetical protein